MTTGKATFAPIKLLVILQERHLEMFPYTTQTLMGADLNQRNIDVFVIFVLAGVVILQPVVSCLLAG